MSLATRNPTLQVGRLLTASRYISENLRISNKMNSLVYQQLLYLLRFSVKFSDVACDEEVYTARKSAPNGNLPQPIAFLVSLAQRTATYGSQGGEHELGASSLETK